MNEAHAHPIRNERGLALRDGFEHRQRGNVGAARLRVVSRDDVVEQLAHCIAIVASREVLEGADTNVAGSHARQHGAWQKILADNLLAGRDHRERARGRNAERMHRFADEVLAQHGAERRASVAIARERRPPRALELDVAPHAVAPHPLT